MEECCPPSTVQSDSSTLVRPNDQGPYSTPSVRDSQFTNRMDTSCHREFEADDNLANTSVTDQFIKQLEINNTLTNELFTELANIRAVVKKALGGAPNCGETLSS